MFESVITYARQRFSLLLFGPLALFLFFFAKGSLAPRPSDYFWLPLVLVLLFLFRLFDDLQNRDFDQFKPNRCYTGSGNYRQLRVFLAGFSAVVFAVLIWVNPLAGFVTTGFFLLNLLLYKLLLQQWKFRNILPLLKYPFLSLLLAFLFRQNQVPVLNQVAISFALFPAFVLYESLTDENFPLQNVSRILLFTAVFLPFLPRFSPTLPGILLAGAACVLLLALLYFRNRTLPYLMLLFLLFTRLTIPL
jgi:hypothetical protein